MDNGKLYYSINEVAAMIGVTTVTLRYWESQFKELKPTRGGKSVRLYTQDDIALLKQIYHLTKECGFTLEGTRDQLRAGKRDANRDQVISDLKEVRQFLVELKETL